MHKGSLAGFMVRNLLKTTEYTLADFLTWTRGADFSITSLWTEMRSVNLPVLVPQVDVPVYFVLGRYDYTTPSELAVAYLEQLRAPYKELVWFEQSAHGLVFEEPEEFVKVMRRVLHRM